MNAIKVCLQWYMLGFEHLQLERSSTPPGTHNVPHVLMCCLFTIYHYMLSYIIISYHILLYVIIYYYIGTTAAQAGCK